MNRTLVNLLIKTNIISILFFSLFYFIPKDSWFVLTIELTDHSYFKRSKASTLPRRSWAIRGRRITMSQPTTSNPIATGSTVIPRDPFETLKNETVFQRNEHIARLTQEIEDLHKELNRVKDLTNFSITLQSPLPLTLFSSACSTNRQQSTSNYNRKSTKSTTYLYSSTKLTSYLHYLFYSS